MTGGGDGSVPSNPASCGSVARMEIGHCVLDAGGDCIGAATETYHFAGLSNGDGMRMVIGPQGSTMLVFLVRADGIDPGPLDVERDSSHPLVQVGLYDSAAREQLSVFRSRVGFTEDSGSYASRQLWVVVDALGSALEGRTISAVANLTDQNGEARCGTVNVVPRR